MGSEFKSNQLKLVTANKMLKCINENLKVKICN